MSLEIESLLTDRQVAAFTGRAQKTLQKDRIFGGGIPFIKVGRLVRYRRQDVEAWLASRPAYRSTSEYDMGRLPTEVRRRASGRPDRALADTSSKHGPKKYSARSASHRDIEDLLAERGIAVADDVVRVPLEGDGRTPRHPHAT